MPLPIAHGLMGACVIAALHPKFSFRRDWRWLLFGAFLGIFPDFDYMLNWGRFLNRGWHHDFTHSILFAILMGWLAAVIARRVHFKVVAIYGLAMLSHPLLDYIYTESRGVELFWPFSNTRFKLGLAAPIDYVWRRSSAAAMLADIATLCAFELVVGASLLTVILLLRRRAAFAGK